MSTAKIDDSLTEDYLNPVQERINTFNEKWEKEFKDYGNVLPPNLSEEYKKESENLTKALYEFTEAYLRYVCGGATNFKVLQLFRHGECTDSKKGLGFKPNANINTAADENMKHFNYSTLLHNKQTPTQVVFSTMTRATSTAANFIEGLAKSLGKDKVLSKSSRKITEIAEGPSGFGIEELSEYGSLINPFSGVKLGHRVMLFFSFLAYALIGSTLKTNEIAKTNALKTISDNSDLEDSDTGHSSDVIHTSNDERKNGVAMEMVNQINLDGDNDVIVIGHGNSIRNTLTAFFPNYAEKYKKDKDALRFAEGQSVMTFDVGGEKLLFMLPFRIQVDQHILGKMNIRATPYAELVGYNQCAENVIQKQKDIDSKKSERTDDLTNQEASYVKMLEYGLTPDDQEEAPLELKAIQPDFTDPVETYFDHEDVDRQQNEFNSH